ncbi:SusE domain-containing protein [Reichenbachiella sp. MSK19-1]|uniref:SusE domain-containing protein n=1 Tax=Reichenbachiella sp. MSK19-1 TaxID=1897631 RepID=UPI000E6C76D5|nr:SusE domain-containing protein [Reichenbachiella sp. MSK19-1]RJE72665.1 hypothetical protein BGP76_01490 [Reichenbachiella sp. MSK19-1]
MKNIIKIYTFILASLVLISCEEELVEKAVLDSESAVNELSELPSSSYILLYDEGAEAFDEFEWTEADYGFSASVTYTLQVAAAGTEFAEAKGLGTTQADSLVIANASLNTTILGMGATAEQAYAVDFRVASSIGEGVDPVYSNVISATVTPYATTFPPIYLIGDAQNWDLAAPMVLESTGPGEYIGIGPFVADGFFRFFETPAWAATQWNADYFEGGTIPDVLINSGDGDANFQYTSTDQDYQITVNLNTKTITMEDAPTLYIIGDDQGWDTNTAFQLGAIAPGVFEGTTTFTQGSIWRFFEHADWAATQYNYTYFEGGTIPADLTDGGPADNNFTNGAATGAYTITVNLNEKTIEMVAGELEEEEEEEEETPTEVTTLFLVGDDQGWSFGTAYELTYLGDGKFEGTTDFTNGSSFRFFGEMDNWSDPVFGYSYFAEGSVTEVLGDNEDADSNFVVVGETGSYTIAIDLTAKTIELTQ